MARVIGSSFRRPFMVQPKQESSLERNLSQFASPQGVYLLAKGLGALGGVSLPWGQDEGGIEKTKLAASARAKAIQSVQDSTKQMRAVKSRMGSVSEAPARPKAADEWREEAVYVQPKVQMINPETNQLHDVFGPKYEPKSEDKRSTPQGMEIVRATREGRPVRKIEESSVLYGDPKNEVLTGFNSLLEVDLETLEDDALIAAASDIGTRNRQFSSRAQKFLEGMMARGQDPDTAMQAVGEQRDKVKKYNASVLAEIDRRTTAQGKELGRLSVAPASEFDPLLKMTPAQQRAEINRLAKGAKSGEEVARVRELVQMHTPEVATFGDLFTSESDRRKEFEAGVEKLIPKIDPRLASDLAESDAKVKSFEVAEMRENRLAEEAKAERSLKERQFAHRVAMAGAKNQTERDRLANEIRRVNAQIKSAEGKPNNFANRAQDLINKHAHFGTPQSLSKLQRMFNDMIIKNNGVLTAEDFKKLGDSGLDGVYGASGKSKQAQAKARELAAGTIISDDAEREKALKRTNPGALILPGSN